LIVAYRGFSGNKGKPTEIGLYEDARSTLNWLINQKIREDQIIIYGESLGTGVSIEVAQNKKFAGIILESPFTSMVDAGKFYYPYLPVSLLLKDRYETIKKLENINSPILVMHGKNDKIVPFFMGQQVFEKAHEPKSSYFPDNDDHMMDYNEDLLETLDNFFKSI
jgi:Hydrolases of the alpha/beta superfamily